MSENIGGLIVEKRSNPKLLSLGDILSARLCTEVQLATVIEKHGVYALDRFHRLRRADKETKKEALDVLAMRVEWLDSFPHVDREDPLDYCSSDNPYFLFGWPPGKCPDIDSLTKNDLNENAAADQKKVTQPETSNWKLRVQAEAGSAVNLTEIRANELGHPHLVLQRPTYYTPISVYKWECSDGRSE